MNVDCVIQDAELHAAWRAGDARAAANLVVRYRPKLRCLGEQLGLSRGEAEELAQEVLLEAPRWAFEARDNSTYFKWLATIARHKVTAKLRKREVVATVRRITTPWTGTWRNEVYASIEAMPKPDRDVFLRLLVGCTAPEIANELGLSHSAVRMRIHRGRKWLKDRGH